MEVGPRGSESDDADDRSPSPGSQGDDNDGLQPTMTSPNVIKNASTGNVKMTRFFTDYYF